MLRRLKSDVDFVIPPKREIATYAPLSTKQQDMYRCILDKTIANLVGDQKDAQVFNCKLDTGLIVFCRIIMHSDWSLMWLFSSRIDL